MRQLYIVFSNEKVAQLVQQLSWTHCLILFPIKDVDKINYYINQILNTKLSKRQLQDIIKSQEYERLPEETKIKLVNQEQSKVHDLIKNPIRIKNSHNHEEISEKVLKRL